MWLLEDFMSVVTVSPHPLNSARARAWHCRYVLVYNNTLIFPDRPDIHETGCPQGQQKMACDAQVRIPTCMQMPDAVCVTDLR